MNSQGAEPLEIRWRSFPLEQVNSQEDGWLFWEQSVEDAKSLTAFLAAEAVRDQGEDIFREFVVSLLTALHERKMRVHELDTIRYAAASVSGLDVDRMVRDMERPELRERIARDYGEAAEEYGVFGTPTLLFPGGDAVFVKMSPPAPPDEAASVFESVRALSLNRPYVQELKKPRKPEKPQ